MISFISALCQIRIDRRLQDFLPRQNGVKAWIGASGGSAIPAFAELSSIGYIIISRWKRFVKRNLKIEKNHGKYCSNNASADLAFCQLLKWSTQRSASGRSNCPRCSEEWQPVLLLPAPSRSSDRGQLCRSRLCGNNGFRSFLPPIVK